MNAATLKNPAAVQAAPGKVLLIAVRSPIEPSERSIRKALVLHEEHAAAITRILVVPIGSTSPRFTQSVVDWLNVHVVGIDPLFSHVCVAMGDQADTHFSAKQRLLERSPRRVKLTDTDVYVTFINPA